MAFVPTAARGFFSLDEHLALLPGKLTPQLRAWLVRLSTWMPFARAAALLTAFTQVQLSEATARRAAEAAGAAYVALQTEEAAQSERDYPPPPVQPERLVVRVDGAMVPLVQGEWAEVKTLALGEPALPTDTDAPHVGAISYFSRLADAETFGHVALSDIQRRGVLAAQAVAAVADGAEWIQGFVDLHCQAAVRILDFAHAAQRLGEVGQALWGEGSAAAQQWTEAQCHELKHAGAAGVLAELRRQQAGHPDNEVLNANLTDLEKRAAQMDYPGFLAQGWPIGSGMVESGNKLVVEARLKGSGMHWARDKVDPMLALPNVVCSAHWAEGWTQMQARLRPRSGARRRARHQRQREAACAAHHARLKAAVPPPVGTQPPSAPGGPPRPGKAHPWRRAFRPHMQDRPTSAPHVTKL